MLEPEARARSALAEDGVVASLMLIHGLYPVPLETRVQEALDSVRPYMESHGGDVELLGVEDGVARLRLHGLTASGCAASQARSSWRSSRRSRTNAPDLLGLDVEGVVAGAAAPRAARQDARVGRARRAWPGSTAGGSWPPAAGSSWPTSPARCSPTATAAPAAAAAWPTASCDGGTLACAHCGRRFDLPRAGRCRDDAGLQLEPVPLLRNGGPVRVALPPARAAVRPRPRTASCARSASARTTATCCTSTSGGSSASARRAGRCARATPSSGRRARARCGSTDFRMPDDLWAAFQIPIGLAFLLRSGVSTGGIVALYPSPAGATESELELTAWDALRAAQPGARALSPTPRR